MWLIKQTGREMINSSFVIAVRLVGCRDALGTRFWWEMRAYYSDPDSPYARYSLLAKYDNEEDAQREFTRVIEAVGRSYRLSPAGEGKES